MICMAKEINQVYTPHKIRHMTDKRVEQILLGLLPMKLTEIYECFGVRRSYAKKTKRRIRNRLNALEDKELVYITGTTFHSLKYHKKDKDQEKTPSKDESQELKSI